MKHYTLLLFLAFAAMVFSGCQSDDPEDSGNSNNSGESVADTVKGFFVLNQGSMGSNKASLDYYNMQTGSYTLDWFSQRNPSIVKGLGDVGNDLQIYGSKLYAVINASNYVEVMDVHNGKEVGSVNVANCRYIVFYNGKAYISSYAGPVDAETNAQQGKVVEVDTASLQITREVTVGYQPEGMVVSNGKLYVANSGGYMAPNYDRTVSVIDLNSFEVTKNIDVAVNLNRMDIDKYGTIYVSSRGNYGAIPSRLYMIDPDTDAKKDSIDIPTSNFCLSGDSLYVLSQTYNADWSTNNSYLLYDVQTKQQLSSCFITDGSQINISAPYYMAVNPSNKDIYVTDARDYVTPGVLYCYSKEGKLKWKVTTGDIPAAIAFTYTKFE